MDGMEKQKGIDGMQERKRLDQIKKGNFAQDDLHTEREELILFYESLGAIRPILHIALVQFILFFQIVLVQNSQRGKELNQFYHQAAATTFAFSAVFISFFYGLQLVESVDPPACVVGSQPLRVLIRRVLAKYDTDDMLHSTGEYVRACANQASG